MSESQISIRIVDNLEGTVRMELFVEGTTRGTMLASVIDNLPEGADVQVSLNKNPKETSVEDESEIKYGDSVSITPKKVDGGAA